jgi:mannan endo-1,4-beta-mannosidase
MNNKKFIAAVVLGLAVIAVAGSILFVNSKQNTSMAGKFVTMSEGKFMLAGRPYYFVGANYWQGMNLAVDGPGRDRSRLVRELDRLEELGVTNLRIMAASEGPDTEPHRMTPALMISPGVYNESVFDGLDHLVAQMSEREMRAVMVLNNYWQWSGGMAQYVSWHEGGPIPYPGDWGVFMNYSANFYTCEECQTWYRNHIATLVNRTNSYTGLTYRDDPAIFAWELANEPRRYPNEWIDETAAYIKSLDPNHLVTTGSEGSPPGERQDFRETHNGLAIDYATIHIWPQNWGWYNPEEPTTYTTAEADARRYFLNHTIMAGTLGKPLVLEEFGLARDWEPLHDIYNPGSPTTYRDRFYAALYEEVFASMSTGGAASGDNFWAWGGLALPGDPWSGDPPHETPGWYSVYGTDESTLAIIRAHAKVVGK